MTTDRNTISATAPPLLLRPLVEDFRGDFENLSAMMVDSWSRRKEQALVYSPEYLRSCFAYPGMSTQLAPTIYIGGAPVAFIAGFPRRVRAGGRELSLVRTSLLTTAPALYIKGWGIVVWSELARRALSLGFDGMINYSVTGLGMDGFFVKCSRRVGLVTRHVFTVNCLARLVRQESDPRGVGGHLPNVDLFLELAASAPQAALSRVWTRAEAAWQFSRNGTLYADCTESGRRGLIAGYLMGLTGAPPLKCALIDDVFWGDLGDGERCRLVQAFLSRCRTAGADMAMVPLLGWMDAAPFHACGFRTSRRVIDVYLSLPAGRASEVEEGPAIYLDVF